MPCSAPEASSELSAAKETALCHVDFLLRPGKSAQYYPKPISLLPCLCWVSSPTGDLVGVVFLLRKLTQAKAVSSHSSLGPLALS